MSRQGGEDKKKLCLYTCLCVHLFRRFVLVQSINFPLKLRAKTVFLLFLAGFYRIISLLQKKSGKGKKNKNRKKDKFRRKR